VLTALKGKKILLGVTGGIAAYKSAELTRLLKKSSADVRVVMTEAAIHFVTPLTFQALSGNPVSTSLLDADAEAAMGHIHLARWADLILVAPATADFMAKLRMGMASDLLSTLCLASESPIALAPAMNQGMWLNRATQDNRSQLERRSIKLWGPASGEQACGETGLGRMLEPQAILEEVKQFFAHKIMKGLSVLIDAGPTQEPIDPVRYISNRSSGKMGYAIADAAKKAGAKVCLVSGPVALSAPSVDEFVAVKSAGEMAEAVLSRAASFDIFIAAAAVADYRPAVIARKKIKKNANETELALEKTEDILAAVSALEKRPFCVGFAAETDSVESYARGKLEAKKLDMIAANKVGEAEGGFESDDNALHLFWNGGEQVLEMAPKPLLAGQLINIIAEKQNENSI
jgi:phosphopantothenoylcysteine decarboxylase/phosphopantothenate--cysteine ligase